MTATTRETILDAAERGLRRGGYDAVSFRDVAETVGVKSASVHHHFPKKADLARAVVARYAERFLSTLGRPDDPAETPRDRLARLAAAYRIALTGEGTGCLCAVLGAVCSALPEPVASEVARFFERLVDWIATALDGAGRNAPTPMETIAALQGAMVLAIATGRPAALDEVGEVLVARLRA